MRHGSNIDPPNRFESRHVERDLEDVQWDESYLRAIDHRPVEYIDDLSQSIVATNRSPDLPFNFSLNPYRGCLHGCSYCYARPTHEYLGYNAGMDFETKIVVKKRAVQLFREFLSRTSWKPEPIAFSGVTDCYQPAEAKFLLTQGCLQVALECNQPVSVITKNALIVRDLEILSALARRRLVHGFLSVSTMNAPLARDMEPRTSIPAARLRAMERLADAGVPVGVMIAPVIPGLNDSEIPSILNAAKQAGAQSAGYTLLRLPLTVLSVFEEWIRRVRPDKAEMVLGRIKQTHGERMNESAWGRRMTGSGELADQIRRMFRIFRQQSGLDGELPAHNCSDFQPPAVESGQLRLFR